MPGPDTLTCSATFGVLASRVFVEAARTVSSGVPAAVVAAAAGAEVGEADLFPPPPPHEAVTRADTAIIANPSFRMDLPSTKPTARANLVHRLRAGRDVTRRKQLLLAGRLLASLGMLAYLLTRFTRFH